MRKLFKLLPLLLMMVFVFQSTAAVYGAQAPVDLSNAKEIYSGITDEGIAYTVFEIETVVSDSVTRAPVKIYVSRVVQYYFNKWEDAVKYKPNSTVFWSEDHGTYGNLSGHLDLGMYGPRETPEIHVEAAYHGYLHGQS